MQWHVQWTTAATSDTCSSRCSGSRSHSRTQMCHSGPTASRSLALLFLACLQWMLTSARGRPLLVWRLRDVATRNAAGCGSFPGCRNPSRRHSHPAMVRSQGTEAALTVVLEPGGRGENQLPWARGAQVCRAASPVKYSKQNVCAASYTEDWVCHAQLTLSANEFTFKNSCRLIHCIRACCHYWGWSCCSQQTLFVTSWKHF